MGINVVDVGPQQVAVSQTLVGVPQIATYRTEDFLPSEQVLGGPGVGCFLSIHVLPVGARPLELDPDLEELVRAVHK